MSWQSETQDAVIVGGGFYGSTIAVYLAQQRGFKRILLIERERHLLMRASYNNQARVHNGYHYPRSFTTAYRSRINLPQFVRDWPNAVKQDFTKLYAIPRRNSKVTAKQFERFCKDIGAGLRTASPGIKALFEPRLIEDVFLVQEYAFDSTALARWAVRQLSASGAQICYQTRVTAISNEKAPTGPLRVFFEGKDGSQESIATHYVFNCTYSGLNQIQGDFNGVKTGLKQEITEMALMEMPAPLKELGITVMDGPFFSTMPFPPRGLHTLSHVRYTPHLNWRDEPSVDPYEKLQAYDCVSRADRMIRDAGRYVPSILKARYVESLFEVKTVLEKNETDDGRPIFFQRHTELPGCYSVLGGKIDNIYDIFEALDDEEFPSIGHREQSRLGGMNG